MPAKLVTRLGRYYALQCSGCHKELPGSFNDVVAVKRRFGQHLDESPVCAKQKAEGMFIRGGRVQWHS